MVALPSVRYSLLALVAGVTIVPTVAAAQVAQTQVVPSDTRRLSDEERQSILAENTTESAAMARGEALGSDFIDRRIHGEVGVMIGSGGSHGIYGVADIPLGDRGLATLSFESSHFGYRR